ncbi:MAG: dehydrogenase E1 component subunit alpha/beta [Gemmatimonadota bacterium]
MSFQADRMAEATRDVTERDLKGPAPDDLLAMYRTMFTSRRLDDGEIRLKRQNRIFFQISGAGHEAVQVAVARHLRPGSDWFYFYYRDRALALALGQPPLDQLLQAVAAEADPNSGGRQMPSHFGARDLNIVSTSSPTGTQFLHAVGTAEAGWRAAQSPSLADVVGARESDEVVLVCAGDGTTSEGEFWEALNTACTLRLPVLFLIEDNGFAISVPVEVQTAGGSISRLVRGFPHLRILECDGTDLLDSHEKAQEAVAYCRSGEGPALLHAHVVRPYSHSMSDDERAYRSEDDRQQQDKRDPLVKARALILETGAATDDELAELEAGVEEEISRATDEALAHAQPPRDTALLHVYSQEVDPTGPDFDTEDSPEYGDDKEYTVVDLLNACMRDEMERNPGVVVFGEDVADASREEILEEVSGKGGVFKVTHGLQRRFGGLRVFNSPLAEANIVGRAFGMAIRGFKPVVEIQFFDYIWPAFHQIRNELATIRYRSNNHFSAPVVVRVTYGGYLKGGAIYHSQTGASLFAHTPGLRVVIPSNAEDANGLLRTAIRCEDPVLFLEHKHLYRQVYNKGRYPGADYMIPFGKARVVQEGSHVTVITCGALVKRSQDAARMAREKHGVEAEIIDLRTISPLDMETIARSVKKTGKALVVHEDSLSFGFGGEIVARIADDLFPWLDGPVRRIASADSWVAYAPDLEEVILPQTPDVLEGILELARF